MKLLQTEPNPQLEFSQAQDNINIQGANDTIFDLSLQNVMEYTLLSEEEDCEEWKNYPSLEKLFNHISTNASDLNNKVVSCLFPKFLRLEIPRDIISPLLDDSEGEN